MTQRYGLNRLTPKLKEEKRQIIKQKAGELGHLDCHHWSKDLNTDTEGGTAQAETTRAFAKSFDAQDKLRMTTLEGGQNDRRGEGNAQNPQAAWNCRPWLIGCEPTGSCRCPSRLSVTPVVQPPVSFSRVPTR